ncbi:MAG: leucine-rich repeat domain-containing protein, partial [Bacteroidales bacterium]|nr:leucine-rich repeat domain-containing protein [Bacteroidales bacterium]
VTEIGASAFEGCESLETIEIPDSVTKIGASAFDSCESLEAIEIPDSVTKIGDAAFYWCINLKEINIPDSVTEIGDSAFRFCNDLKNVTFSSYISISKIGNSTFQDCNSLEEIKLPNSVTEIGYFAFEGCMNLKSINIPDSVTEIGDSAFQGCKNLESIEIPDSVTKIGDSAFKKCKSLKEINIPDSVTEIGDSAFRFCGDLKNVTFSSTISISKIGNSTFQDCNSLEEIKLPNSVTIIGDSAFENCGNFNEFHFPNSLVQIGLGAFRNCRFYFLKLPNTLTRIGMGAFCRCLHPDLSTLSLTESDRYFIQYDPSWASTTEDNVRKLYATAQRAFIQSVFLRNKQHNIGSHVAAKCSNLEFVRNLLTKSDKDYEPLFEGELNPALIIDAENQLAELNLYNFQRDSYCTDLASGTPGNCEYISIRDMLASLDKNRLLLNLISGYVGVFKYHFEIYFEEEDTCATIDDTRLNWPVAIPNGQIGCHAFYNIIENIIRNTAKYAFRTDTDKDVAICIRFRTESSYESSKQQLDNDLYFVEIYSNIDQRDICRLVAKQNEYIDLPIIERVTMDSRSEAKGMVEMKASATYLQGKDIVNLEDGAYIHIGHSTPSDYQGHQSALDKYGNPIQLKAFALAAETTDSDKTSSESNFPEYKLSNSTKKEKKYHYLSEGEQTIHQGFLGYRFFMLKPKKVLFVGDNATTTKLLQNVRYELSNWESSIMNPEGIKDKDTLIQKTHFVKKALKNHLSYGTSGELDIFIRDLRDPNGYHPLCWREQLVKDLKKALGERYDSESFFPEIVETLCNNGYGIDFWTSDQLEQHIKDKKNVAYEIMVCGDTHLVSKHKSRLPKRIICQTPADFFCEFKNSCSKSLSDVEGVLPEIEGFAWKKYTESKDYTHKNFFTDNTDKASFLNHNQKDIFDKNNIYIEALSSAAQQKLPGWFELAKKTNGSKVTLGDFSDYIANVRKNGLPKNRLLESINTRVFMLDENLQSTAKSTFPFGDTERSLLTHLKKCQILFPDCDLSEISPSDFLNIMRDIKVKGYEKPYDFIFFHYGLLERMFEQMDQNELKELQTMYPEIDIDNSNKKALMVEYLNLLAKEHDVVVKSGRGVPESLPYTVRFVHQISVDQALVEIKSKYLFSNLLYSSRSK